MTVPELRKRKTEGRKIIMVTAYDALFARIIEEAGIDVLLVGDSLGVVVQGKKDTLSVTMEDMLYHTRLVTGVAARSLVIGDMPFLSYQVSVEEAVRNAGRFLQAGAAVVKIEGGESVLDRVRAMIRAPRSTLWRPKRGGSGSVNGKDKANRLPLTAAARPRSTAASLIRFSEPRLS